MERKGTSTTEIKEEEKLIPINIREKKCCVKTIHLHAQQRQNFYHKNDISLLEYVWNRQR